MDNLALTLGVLAGLVQLAGYWQYNKAMSHAGHKPNAASWFMWGIGGVTELVVYSSLVKDRSKEILPAVCAVVVIITFVRIWWRDRTLNMDCHDWIVVGFDALVVVFWFVTKNPFAANALLGIDMFLSFIPIIGSTYRNPASEHPHPWATWTIAYSLLTLVVILQWENSWELIYPVLYVVLHGVIWYISGVKSARTAAI